MAILSVTFGLYAVAAYFVFTYVQGWQRRRQFARFAAANNAELCPHVPRSWIPWGIDGVIKVLGAERKGLDFFDDLLLPGFKTMGSNTYGITGLFGRESINSIEPAIMQSILATNFKDWEAGEERAAQFGAVLGDGVLTTDGERWTHFRSLLKPQFSRENINDLDFTEKQTHIFMDVLPASEDKDSAWTAVVDLQQYFYRFTIDTATHFLFGSSVHSQLTSAGRPVEGSAEEAALFAADEAGDNMTFSEAFSLSEEFMSVRIRLQSLYWLCNGSRYRKAARKVKRVADFYVKKALANPAVEKAIKNDEDKQKLSLLERLTQQTRDPIELRDQLVVLLVAGRGTTADLLAWIFFVLAMHPAVFAKLRASIVADFGPRPAEGGPPLSMASLKACKYLQHVLNETLRYYPVVPANSRIALRDTILPVGGGPDGTRPMPVMKGQQVMFLSYGMQRRKDLWGEDADVFKPERWEGRKMDWTFLPFSGGPRICLGQQVAITEASYLMVRLLQEFDGIEWCGAPEYLTGTPPRKHFTVTMNPLGGVPVRLRRAAK